MSTKDRTNDQLTSMNAGRKSGDTPASRPARLRILDKEVQIGCKPGEEDDLMQAAEFVDKSMRDLRKRNTTSSIEKIAIVTAINTAHSLLKTDTHDSVDGTVLERISAMNDKLDQILANTSPDNTEKSD